MLAKALRLIRVFHDMKQMELAQKLHISKSYLSEIESGKKQPPLSLIDRYAKEFNVPCSSILFFAESLENPSKSATTIAPKIVQFLRIVESINE